MSETTAISYAHHTASPWYGCTEVSAGCANCYARSWGRKLKVEWGKGKPRMRSKSFERNVRKWNRAQEPFKGWANYERPRIFPSLCDWLDSEVPTIMRLAFLRTVWQCQNLDWLLPTKRIELWRELVNEVWKHSRDALQNRSDFPRVPEYDDDHFRDWLQKWVESGEPPHNIWLGVSCENQRTADDRIPLLLKIPAKVRWVSAEPLLEAIQLPPGFNGGRRMGDGLVHHWANPFIDWLVVGGESGPKRRDCGVEAIVDVARQCQAAGVPVWVKQDCALKPGRQGRIPQDVWQLKQLPD